MRVNLGACACVSTHACIYYRHLNNTVEITCQIHCERSRD